MRLVIVLLVLALTAAGVRAADWTRYDNPRFGYEIAIPPGFAPDGPPPDNGDGRVFVSGDGSQLLRVYGGNIVEGDFADVARFAMDAAADAGWSLSYKRTTERWTSYSGTRHGMILYARGISLCGGAQFASFEIEYPREDLDAMNSVVEELVESLKATGNGMGC